MHQIPADEFSIIKGNVPFRLTGFLSSGRKGNLFLRYRKNSAVGNGNLVGITPKIFNGITKAVKGLFDVRHQSFS